MSGLYLPPWIEWTLTHGKTVLVILAVLLTGGLYGLWRLWKRIQRMRRRVK